MSTQQARTVFNPVTAFGLVVSKMVLADNKLLYLAWAIQIAPFLIFISAVMTITKDKPELGTISALFAPTSSSISFLHFSIQWNAVMDVDCLLIRYGIT